MWKGKRKKQKKTRNSVGNKFQKEYEYYKEEERKTKMKIDVIGDRKYFTYYQNSWWFAKDSYSPGNLSHISVTQVKD